jgi:hypothetical protein
MEKDVGGANSLRPLVSHRGDPRLGHRIDIRTAYEERIERDVPGVEWREARP